MLIPDIVHSKKDLEQILFLQQQNLRANLTKEEQREQGFVTLQHNLDILEQMHSLAPSILVRDEDKVAGYALTMLPECRHLIPDLEPLFAILDQLSLKNQPLSNKRFYVMGQVCIAKPYRGQGLFETLYHHHKLIYQSRFDLLVTEIATRNLRSVRAHERIGFKTIHTHKEDLDEWLVVAWDWN